ncbi:growth arrest and DNA damage-inducible protein GADD45 gamma [Schistocerca americana]|uniref:growth arrest and DNA damage-inducible protein GADD45 gamma n=1 Tax=Schistocerca americana TaxID=7009 RepID=UPI001F4F3EFF|nr:growth arrest and DNA damage-inducible protein GADD45 gamma [Schistocerca americana]XP_047117413.1 growth arrest and DNA damage-inducible protein GADD45 gamma [Schistocerca piceifrons]XP_049788262.1 growth arrest and DNA damage-inducible protein GADD45 gamma [Schistocerca cancellata]XP_049815864.1 growth arrest and DNA damage-inducible protein GADD45 gamma [Schistocerca nitens]XP_049832029.1 growth arrest and DNA damage-inducible protein GADD45 gamma [Schistocerca gregaria]XP_049963774.1 gr
MTLEDVANKDSPMANRKKLCQTVRCMLRRAQAEKRLACGLLPAIKLLESDPGSVLFCVLPQTAQGDSAMHHIHTVLLQAFCYENDINIIEVDSAERVSSMVAPAGKKPRPNLDTRCVLVLQPQESPPQQRLSDAEEELVRWCDAQPQPAVIKLPAL